MRQLIPYLLSVCLTITFLIAATDPTFSQSKNEETPGYVRGLTTARAKSLVGVVAGLISVIAGWRARKNSVADVARSRWWGIISLTLALTAVVFSAIHLANVTGGFGSGGGKAGAIVGLVLGAVGIIFSALAFRSKTRQQA